MNARDIVRKEGYRYEDLTDSQKRIMDGYSYALEDMKHSAELILTDMEEDGSAITEIKLESAQEFLYELEDHMEINMSQQQIGLAEDTED